MRASTIPGLLSQLLRADASRPLVTFYDDGTGERVELSVATYANWVSKTASLLQDELDVEHGGRLLLDVSTHWLAPVWLGAAWTLGLCVTNDRGRLASADLVVCGPDGLERYAGSATVRPVVAMSLRPLGGRFVDPLPEGVVDYAAVVLGQPDAFVPYEEAEPDDLAWESAELTATQAELLERVAGNPVVEAGGRLLTDVNPCTDEGMEAFLAVLAHQAGVVLVARPDEAAWDRRVEQERATGRLRASRT